MKDDKPKDKPEETDPIQPREPTPPNDGDDDDDTTPGNVPSPGRTNP